MVSPTALFLVLGLSPVLGQRSNALIQSLVTRLKNSPKHYSISPSYTSDRKLDVIPVSGLPLQSDVVPGSESSGPAPSITDVITGNLGKFETSGEGDNLNGSSDGKEDSDALSLASQHRPRIKKPRRRRPGRLGARPARLARPGGRPPPPGRREKPRPPRRSPHLNQIEQVPVEEFFPGQEEEEEEFYLEAARPARPGRRGPLKEVYRPSGLGKRKHESPPLVFQSRPPTRNELRPPRKEARPPRKEPRPPRPLKNEIRPHRKEQRPPPRRELRPPGQAPRKKRKPSGSPNRQPKPPRSNKRKPGNFRPPKKIYNGFEPSFESSNPYNDDPLYLDDMDFRKPNKPKRPKRKRRPRPPAPIPDLEPFGAEEEDLERPNYPNTPTDFNPFNKPDHGMNFENQPGFDRNSHKSPMSINKPGPPYETELSPFIDEEPRLPSPRPTSSLRPTSSRPSSLRPTRPRATRPKRQKVPASFEPNTFVEGPSIYNEFNDVASNSDDNSGFFQNVQENFPAIEAFGIGWDSQKIRRKRSANGGGGLLPLVRYTPPSKNRRKGRRGTTGRGAPRRSQNQQQQSNRRQGPAGFWDDAEFDAEFFNGGAPPSYSSFESFSQQNRFQSPLPPLHQTSSRRPSRRPSPHIASKKYETSQKFHEPGRYSTSYQEEPSPQYQGFSEPPRFQHTPVVDNSILGSGNFEILKGGTFYDKNDYRQYSHNSRPQSYGYGQNDIFHNFRDFADIKKENSRPGGRYNSYY